MNRKGSLSSSFFHLFHCRLPSVHCRTCALGSLRRSSIHFISWLSSESISMRCIHVQQQPHTRFSILFAECHCFSTLFFFNLLPQENRGGVIRWAWQHMDLQKMLMLRFLILIFLPSLSFLFYHSSSSSFDCVRFPRRTRRNKNHDLPNSSQQTTVVPSSTYPPLLRLNLFLRPSSSSQPISSFSKNIQSNPILCSPFFFFLQFSVLVDTFIHLPLQTKTAATPSR
ncbi:hypothetical protein BKA57DRAFT_72185 [Linnemannia elongata]|nr:hypothetical protein BKA57DRAFT_72185 [Linnemannia elongata]